MRAPTSRLISSLALSLSLLALPACDSSTVGALDRGPGGGDGPRRETGAPLTETGGPLTEAGTPFPEAGGPLTEAGGKTCKDDSGCGGQAPYCSSAGVCVPCDQQASKACKDSSRTCCGTSCVDTATDLAHCGGCGKPCTLANATAACGGGKCTVGACAKGFLDCDQAAANGCEAVAGDAGTCACAAKSTAACYEGPQGTEGVGPCKGGTKTCNDQGTGYGACTGQVLPEPDRCDNAVDDNCDGVLNNGFPSATGCGCVPKSTQPCYSGPKGTEGVGICTAGTQTCKDDGTDWGPCTGDVLPEAKDTCLDPLDNDCNGKVNDGFASGAPGCTCTPGATRSCYTGPAGTQGKGVCKAGTETCDATGTAYGICAGEVKPSFDLCADGVDQDCNGTADNPPDLDGDGWNVCQGDCCDTPGVCGDPELVNPGAYEVPGNKVDDDCDGVIDNPVPACDTGLATNSSTPMDYAKAIDLCQTTTEAATGKNKKWGVISAQLLLASGSGTPHVDARSIRPGFGSVIVPKQGSSLAVLSTGNAADKTDTNPSYYAFQGPAAYAGGRNLQTSSAFPADWLTAHGGVLPNAPGCPAPDQGTTANDPIMLKLRIRVPTNAKSFALNTYFFSSEYPEYTCSPYNDFFVALLDSGFKGTPANPTDKNLAVYTTPGGLVYPVGVNLAAGNTGLFKQCQNGATGCDVASGTVPGTMNTCVATNELTGTRFDDTSGNYGCPWANNAHMMGGGTGWLNTKGNVNPGEVIEVRFAVWDTSDHIFDSLILLDNWIWSVTASKPGTDG